MQFDPLKRREFFTLLGGGDIGRSRHARALARPLSRPIALSSMATRAFV